MAFATKPVGEAKPLEKDAPKIYHEDYKHSIIDSAYQPEMSILSMVDGAPRLVEYYRQFLGRDEMPIAFQPNDVSTYQSYTRIKQLIIKQEGNGAYQFDPDTGQSTSMYSGYVIFDLTPIRGDVFIADIGDGKAGLFVLTEQPEIRNFTSNKVYYITYQLVSILSNNLWEELNKRVVSELVYSKDSAINGGNAVITTGDYDIEKKLMGWIRTISDYLMSTYYWNNEKTIAIKEGQQWIYDPYLVEFITAVIPTSLRPRYAWINQPSIQYGGHEFGYNSTVNIWTVLLKRDFNLLPICKREAGKISTLSMSNTRLYGNIFNSTFDYVIVTDPDNFVPGERYYNFDGAVPYQAPKVEKFTYIFTEEFYQGLPQNDFESLIIDVLKNGVIDRRKLLAYCEGYFNLDYQAKLYNGAILMLLLQASRKIGTGI